MRANISRLNRLLASIRFTAVQVGARNGFTEELAPVAGAVDAVAFEADRTEAALLAEDARGDTEGYRTLRILPFAIAAGSGTAQLNLTRDRSWSALQSADAGFARLYARAARFEIEETTEAEAATLDEAADGAGIEAARYLRISAAANPLEVIGSGPKLVDGLCAVRAGVLFAPIYRDQPLFADLDLELRARGFELASLEPVETWRRGSEAPRDSWIRGATPLSDGRPIAAEALYLRRVDDAPSGAAAEQDRLIAHALIAFAAGQLDTAAAVLMRPAVRQRVLELCAVDIAVLLHDLGRWHARRRRRQVGADLMRRLGVYLRLSGH